MVGRQVLQTFTTKSEALQFDSHFDSAYAEICRRHREKVTPCCSIGGKLRAFLDDSRAGLGRRPCGTKTFDRHRHRLETFDKAFQ